MKLAESIKHAIAGNTGNQHPVHAEKRRLADSLFKMAVCNLSPGDLAIDCGANAGRITTMMAESGADVLAYEPDSNLLPRLNQIAKKWPNLTLHAAAVGVEAGSITLFRSPYYETNPVSESVKNTIIPGAKTRAKDGGWREMDDENTSTVELVNIIDVLKENIAKRGRIALLKIDIEGAELDILEKMDKEGLFKHIGFTVAELHGFRFPNTRERIEKLKASIRRMYPPEVVNFDWG